MQVMQVRKYHEEIANKKFDEAMHRWAKNGAGNGMPRSSMFFFRRTDSQGYEMTYRKNGYVAFDDKRAIFAMSKAEAIRFFNRGGTNVLKTFRR